MSQTFEDEKGISCITNSRVKNICYLVLEFGNGIAFGFAILAFGDCESFERVSRTRPKSVKS